MMKIKLILAGIFLFLSHSIHAQIFEIQEAQQAFQNQEYQRVAALTKTVLNRDPLNLQAYQLLASSQLAQLHPEMAEQSANKGLEYFPEKATLKWILAEAKLQQGLLDDALPIYEQLLHVNSSLPKENIQQRLGLIYQTKGGYFYQQEQLNKAEEYLKKSMHFMPDTLASYSNLALVYIKQEEWDEALEVIDQGIIRFPKNPSLMQMRASALFHAEDYDGVLDEYEKLYNYNPNNLDNALPYAQLLLAQGNKEEASAIYNRLLDDNPDERRIYESLIEYYDQRGDLNAKRQALQKMRKQFPEDVSILNRIADTYELQENWENARSLYDTVQVLEGNSESLAISVANTFIQEDSLKAADVVYEEALADFPKSIELLRLRGELQQKRKQWEVAERTYLKLIGISENSYGYSQLGLVQLELGKKELAFSNLKYAVKLGSEDPETYLLLSTLYLEKDDDNAAFFTSERALRIALENMQEFQQMLSRNFQEVSMSGFQSAEKEAKGIEENNTLAIEAFSFIASSFSRDRVMPLMQLLQEEYSNSGRLIYLISTYYRENEREQEGLDLLKESVQLSPNLAEAHKALGQYFASSDLEIQAIRSYERALSVDPDDRSTYTRLIELYRELGKLDELTYRWYAHYRANSSNDVLKESLIEALHKSGRYEDASKVINPK